MVYTCTYPSPLGNILLAADEVGLTGLWFEGQKYFGNTLPKETVSQEIPVLIRAKKWLDVYFSGKEPDFTPALHPAGSTFRQAVWQILLQIPYGQTMTYGEIAKKMTQMHDAPHMSAQAVGSAVGHNEVSIIIPCHRVVGVNGSLTGYAGGIDKKTAKDRNLKLIWALALPGKVAPVTTAEFIKDTIYNILKEIYKK